MPRLANFNCRIMWELYWTVDVFWRTRNFPHFFLAMGTGRRSCLETTRALNFYTLLGAAVAKSTTLSASKTASARLPRPPVVALISRPASIVRFNKVQQSGTQHGGISPRRLKLLHHVYLTFHVLHRFEIHFSPRIIFFFYNYIQCDTTGFT